MKRRIKLLMLISNLSTGGTERVFANIMNHLPREKFEIYLGIWRDDIGYKIRGDISVNVIGKYHFWDIGKAIFATKKLIEKIKPDIVFSAISFTNIVTGTAVYLSNWKTRWICRFGSNLRQDISLWARIWGIFAIKKADKVIGNSLGVSRTIVDYLKVDPSIVETIYNPIDFDDLSRLSLKKISITRDNNRFLMIHAGRFIKEKNQQLILRSLAVLVNQYGIDSELWMLGIGDLEDELKELAKRLNISSRVKWLGFKRNPFKYYKAADCFVLTSNWEGLPNALIEAMACGTAAISTDCDFGPREVIKAGKTGLLVPVNDLGALSRALARIAKDNSLREKIAQEGQKRVRDKFHLEKIIEDYTVLLLDTIAEDKHIKKKSLVNG